MHGTYHGREADLRALACLMEHGPAYYHMLARSARRNLELAGAGEALGRFDALMGRFDSLVAYLVGQRRTLVHGDIFAQNLVLQSGARIRAIDWESAAIGLGAWDLARLLDGWGSHKAAFLPAYRDEFARHAAVPWDQQTFDIAFAHCRILNALWHLRWDVGPCRDEAYVGGLLKSMATVWNHLDKGTTDA
jgi:aminoglycoside phosphotransferase (APT) family kinase protein